MENQTPPTVMVTEKARNEIKRIMAEQNMSVTTTALRVRVVGGGCSGWQNKLDLDETFNEKTDTLEMHDDVRVVIDKRSALYLTGATIDFHDDLNKRGFVVSNPAAKTTCGCGSSWSM